MAHQFNKLQARLDQMEEDHEETATQLTRDLQQQVLQLHTLYTGITLALTNQLYLTHVLLVLFRLSHYHLLYDH